MRKIWDIPGGIHPPENKHQSNQTAIAQIALPSEIILPLNQHIGAPAVPQCVVGDSVLKGQLIADAQGFVSAAVHASTSGTISAIEDRHIVHSSGMQAPCIVITPDGQDTWIPLEQNDAYLNLDKTILIDKIRHAGIAGMGGAGFPTSVKLQPRANQKIDTLILNGTECEPYITADDMLMRERASDILHGAQLLAHILAGEGSAPNVLIGIEDNKPQAIATMQAALHEFDSGTIAIEIVVFPTKYPSGGEKQLIQILTGKEVKSGNIPADIGIVVQNIGTAAAAYRAARFGEPLISRITTVVGQSLAASQNIEVLIGTPIDHVLAAHGYNPELNTRLIIGGPMMGFAMEHIHIPVVKTTNCILAPSHSEMPAPPPAQACIRCGMCAQACPASLLPQQLFWFSRAEEFDKLREHNLFDCIECGACSYVCPSNIPLVQYYRASKGTIRQLDAEKTKSDRSRKRFEFRKERVERAEAEKEAKRLARKQAAAEAKKALAEKAANETNTARATTNTHQPDASAVKQASSSMEQDPQAARKKLARALSSAENRLERAQKQLADARAPEEGVPDEKRINTLEARLKQAELKVNEAKEKLENFATEANGNTATSNDDSTVKNKLAMSALEKQQKSVATLAKRLATAQQKATQAQADKAPTAAALRQGVDKLTAKLSSAQKELTELEQLENGDQATPQTNVVESSAADRAIAKAKEKAAAQAQMSDEEKAQAQLASLKARLEKARERLAKAEAENSEHIAAFQAGVEKLEAKLAQTTV